MKKAISTILVITILVICFPIIANADVTYSVNTTVSYADDLVYITNEINAPVSESNGIVALSLKYQSNVSDLNDYFTIEAIDLSGLPDETKWEKMGEIIQTSVLFIDIQCEEDDAPIYSASSPATVTLVLRKNAVSETEITFTLTKYEILDLDYNEYYSYVENSGATITISNEFTVSLAEQALVPTVELLGAQIRTAEPQGLRFVAQFTKDEFYEQYSIIDEYVYNDNSPQISFGVLIAFSSSVGEGTLTHESNFKKLDIVAEKILNETDDYIQFTGVVKNFPTDGTYDDTMFTAVAYVKAIDESAEIETYNYYYSTPIEKSVNGVKAAEAAAAAAQA